LCQVRARVIRALAKVVALLDCLGVHVGVDRVHIEGVLVALDVRVDHWVADNLVARRDVDC